MILLQIQAPLESGSPHPTQFAFVKAPLLYTTSFLVLYNYDTITDISCSYTPYLNPLFH